MIQAIADDTQEAEAIWNCLTDAIARFNASGDQDTLLRPSDRASQRGPAAGERAIAHRLAYYMECALRKADFIADKGPLVVDCEYNRHGGAAKTVAVESELKALVEAARKKKRWEPEEDGFYVFSVAPDIVVHERGHDRRNRLVVELKKASNRETPKYDALKLELFTIPRESDYGYGYSFGAWVIAEDRCNPKGRCLHIVARYKNGIRCCAVALPEVDQPAIA